MAEHLTMDVDVENCSRLTSDPHEVAEAIVEEYNEWATRNGYAPVRLRTAAWVVPWDADRSDPDRQADHAAGVWPMSSQWGVDR